MPTEQRSFRMDFKLEITSFDEKTGLVQVRLIFDPDRYEHKVINGEDGYFDKFDSVFIPMKTLENSLPQLNGMPIHYSPPRIEDADKYIYSRIGEIEQFFESRDDSFEFKDISEEYLEKLEKDKMRFVILSIDLKGSTKMSQELPPEINSQIISLFLREITLIVDKFNGYVLKYVGDGLIAYFPEPNFIGMNDNAIDCAMTMKKIIIYGINPILKEKGFPELNFRIGLDSGEAIIKTLGVKTIKMDLTTPEFKEEIRSYFGKKIDLLLSDASIKKSGIKFSDDVNQINLCFKILEIGKEFLRQNGNMVIKIFQGTDYDKFHIKMKREFKFVLSYKPKSSRKTSNEIYLIGMKKK